MNHVIERPAALLPPHAVPQPAVTPRSQSLRAPASLLVPDARPAMPVEGWFAALGQPLREAITACARVKVCAAGSVLGVRGDAATAWIGVDAGALRLGTTMRDGRDFILGFVSPGQWFGDIALVDERPLEFDIAAHVDSRLLFVSKPDLKRLLAEHESLGAELLRLNCQRLRHLFRRFEELQTLPLGVRVARELRRLARQFARQSPDGRTLIDLAISQAELSAMVGGSRQRVNRVMRQMHVMQILRLGGPRIVVSDARKLDAAADGAIAFEP